MFSIDTPRLRLRPWRLDDFDPFFAIVTDHDVMRYIGPGVIWDAQRTRDYIRQQMDSYRQRGFCLWAVDHKADEAMVGFCGLRDFGEGEIEIGWRLAKAYWAGGLATEAARAALRHAFEEAGVQRVVAVAQLPNQASMRIMEKIGMRYLENRTHDSAEVACYVIDAPPRDD